MVPRSLPISLDTLVAMDVAATLNKKELMDILPCPFLPLYLLGCVTATAPLASNPASTRNCGTCVVLPEPVSPISTTEECLDTSSRNLRPREYLM